MKNYKGFEKKYITRGDFFTNQVVLKKITITETSNILRLSFQTGMHFIQYMHSGISYRNAFYIIYIVSTSNNVMVLQIFQFFLHKLNKFASNL